MPLYYFHLSFGERMLPDEEGVELPNRKAAREEALAVIHDLSDREAGRRWASWFLDVTDEQGSFLRLPIGYPALEVLPKDGHRPRRAASGFKLGYASVSAESLPKGLFGGRPAELVRERLAIRQRTMELLEQNRRLRQELSSEFSSTRQIRLRVRQLLSPAPSVEWVGDAPAADVDGGQPPRSDRPHLVLLPGGAID
jgi:uncharacterized protein DUF6894